MVLKFLVQFYGEVCKNAKVKRSKNEATKNAKDKIGIPLIHSGADPGFEVKGGVHKIIAASGARRGNF